MSTFNGNWAAQWRPVIVFIALTAIFLAAAASCRLAAAAESVWEGSAYLQVPVRLGSDTRLVMPESFDDAWERESEVACTLLDARTLIIRPRSSNIEQRLTLRGRKTGTRPLENIRARERDRSSDSRKHRISPCGAGRACRA